MSYRNFLKKQAIPAIIVAGTDVTAERLAPSNLSQPAQQSGPRLLTFYHVATAFDSVFPGWRETRSGGIIFY